METKLDIVEYDPSLQIDWRGGAQWDSWYKWLLKWEHRYYKLEAPYLADYDFAACAGSIEYQLTDMGM